MRKHPQSHREAKATAPVLDSTRHSAYCPVVKTCNGLVSSIGRRNWLNYQRSGVIGANWNSLGGWQDTLANPQLCVGTTPLDLVGFVASAKQTHGCDE
jgi:hypothetical protein